MGKGCDRNTIAPLFYIDSCESGISPNQAGLLLRAVGRTGHGEGSFIEDEDGYGGTHAQPEQYGGGGDTVFENFEQVVNGFVVVSAALQKSDEREHGAVGIHTRNHGEQCRNVEHGGRTENVIPGKQAEHAYRKGCNK